MGYFIPPQPGSLDDYLSYPRDTDAVFVEWDRKLMWVGAGTGLYLVACAGARQAGAAAPARR